MKRKYFDISFLIVSIYISFMGIGYLVWTIRPDYDLTWLFTIAAIGVIFIPITIFVPFAAYLSNQKSSKEKLAFCIINLALILLSTIFIYVVIFTKFGEVWSGRKDLPDGLTIALCVIAVVLNFFSLICLFIKKAKKSL